MGPLEPAGVPISEGLKRNSGPEIRGSQRRQNGGLPRGQHDLRREQTWAQETWNQILTATFTSSVSSASRLISLSSVSSSVKCR